MKIQKRFVLASILSTSIPGMSAIAAAEEDRAEVTAAWAADGVVADGRLDEAVWDRATAYSLQIPKDRQEDGPAPIEAGVVRFAYDADALYVAFAFDDRDIVQESDADQEKHFQTGDVAELFLKPASATWYWELYATPNARRSAYFFPGRGRKNLPGNFEYDSEVTVGAQIDGTRNRWRDEDRGWTAELRIPRAELAAVGVPLDADHTWRVLGSRYNYGVQLPAPELSAHPTLPRTDFHAHESWAELVLEPAAEE